MQAKVRGEHEADVSPDAPGDTQTEALNNAFA